MKFKVFMYEKENFYMTGDDIIEADDFYFENEKKDGVRLVVFEKDEKIIAMFNLANIKGVKELKND